MDFKRPIIVIAGPTASGKSSLALKLAQNINGVIINADSRQIYKELNIGTAKPIPDKIDTNGTWYIDNIPHLLYGLKSIKDSYNIYEYQKDIQHALGGLEDDRVPILTGGTGLYIDSVVFNYELKNTSEEKKHSQDTREKLENMSIQELQNLVDKNVLESLNNSDRNNPVRLIRIIQGRDLAQTEKGTPLHHIYFVVNKNKDLLKERISERVEQMLKEGLVEENRKLFEDGLLNNSIVQKTIGYQEFDGYFDNQKTLEDVKKDIIQNTLKYAKRQKTWFRRNPNCIWTDNYEEVLDKSLNFIRTS